MAKRRKAGEGTLTKRKDGRWEARVVVSYDEKGMPKTKNVTAVSKAKCLEKLEKLKAELGAVTKKTTPTMSFGEWMDFWYQTYCKNTLKESTQATYEQRIYKQIIPKLGHIPLNQLNAGTLEKFYAQLKSNGRLVRRDIYGPGLANSVIRSIHAHCRAALEKAVTENRIPIGGICTERIYLGPDGSVTRSEGSLLNTSDAATTASSSGISTNGGFYFGLKEMGKKGRSLTVGAEYGLSGTDKESHETSVIRSAEQTTAKDLFYDTDMNNISGGAALGYSEPLADKWAAEASVQTRYYRNRNTRNAADPDGAYNDYYSSFSDNRYLSNRGAITVQYSNDTTTVQFGMVADAVKNEMRSKSLGVETVTGKDEWLLLSIITTKKKALILDYITQAWETGLLRHP